MEYCPICQGINVQSLAQAFGYQHLTLGKLHRSRKTCRMCDFLCKIFEDLWCSAGRSDITDILNDTWSLNMQLTEGPTPKLRLTASDQTEDSVVEDVILHAHEGDPALLMGLRPRLSPPSSTRSPESFATARTWIGDCLSGHPRVERSAKTEIQHPGMCRSDSKDRPRRLVHVLIQGSGLLLRLTDVLSDAKAYATLSHCWGAGPWTWITSKANLHQRKVGFSEAELPSTIRDACFAALNLNIPYIWVDCLCIVQDDADEWALEAPKMGSIYNGSIVTISATSAASGYDGLFNTTSSSVLARDAHREITIESRLPCGSSSILQMTRPDTFPTDTAAWTDYITNAPLMQRAWVCQERMSSPRIMHYAAAQLFWECEHCTLSEDNAIISSHGVTTEARSRLLFLSLYRSTVSQDWDLAPMKEPWLHPLNRWYSYLIGDRYSRCGLTFKQDKLIAISGLAKLIHVQTSIPYYAGHWFHGERWFLDSLCWQRDSAGAKTPEYHAPSWSWASQDSAVIFSGVSMSVTATHHPRLVHISVDPAATFGSLSAGDIILEGHLLALELKYIPYTDMWDAHSKTDASDLGTEFHYLDDDTEPLSDTLPYALVMTTYKDVYRDSSRDVYFLILEEVQPAETLTMKRIGFGQTSTDREWARELLDAPVAQVRII